MPRSIQILPTPAELFRAAGEEFISVGNAAIAARGRYSVALSGGSTPRNLYSLLAHDYAGFAWDQTHLFFGDERHVPPTDSESNYWMVKESLLSKISIPEANVHRVLAENPDAAAAAQAYENELRSYFPVTAGEFPRFDLILLGMGPDGHAASLFPGSDGLQEKTRWVIANWVKKLKTHRITFTFPVLNHAGEAMFLTSGADKADMLHQALEGKNSPPYPSQLIQPTDGKLLWMVDAAAAGKLASSC